MLKRCKNCKYWDRNKEENKDFGKCTSSKYIYDTTCCGKDIVNDAVYYMDYEWYRVDLEMGKDFGCIHFADMVVKTDE